MSKLITDYLKRSCSATLSTKEQSSLSTVEISSSSQRTESDAQTSRTIYIYEEKSTNENNETSFSTVIMKMSQHMCLIHTKTIQIPLQVQTEASSKSTMFQGSNCKIFSDILEYLESLHPTKCSLIPNPLTIALLILINPATSCTHERSFSVARKIKTWLRSTMTTGRFNNQSILSVHKQLYQFSRY